jgi:predicted metal-dependent hydrolase
VPAGSAVGDNQARGFDRAGPGPLSRSLPAATRGRRAGAPPVVVRGTLALGDAPLRYTVSVCRVERATWVAYADRVHVRLPRGLARSRSRMAEVAALVVRGDAAAIARAMAGVADRQAARTASARAALGAHAFLLRGRLTRLVAEVHPAARQASVEHLPGALTVVLPPGALDAAEAVAEAWLRRQAAVDLAERLAVRSGEMGLRHGRVRVRDQASRWGSCSTTTNLAFSWRLVLAPPEVLDYLVVHELAHLVEMNHGPAFWALVGRHCPDWRRSRRWLRANEEQLRVPLSAARPPMEATGR